MWVLFHQAVKCNNFDAESICWAEKIIKIIQNGVTLKDSEIKKEGQADTPNLIKITTNPSENSFEFLHTLNDNKGKAKKYPVTLKVFFEKKMRHPQMTSS